MIKPTVLIMFSGGLDSTGVLLEYVNSQAEFHVHHLHLVNKENRADAENKAVTSIVEWTKKIREFGFSESYHEYPCYNGNFLWDSDIFSFMAGAVCLSVPSIRHVAIGMTKSDLNSNLSSRITRANKIFDAFGTKAEKIYPLMDKTKNQVYEMMPEELRELTWTCRTPKYVGSDVLRCGRCKGCGELEKIKSR